MARTTRTHKYVDIGICLIMAAIYTRIAQSSKIEVNTLFFIRLTLVSWLGFLMIKVVRLLQYMASFDIDLRDYSRSNLKGIEIPLQYKTKMWGKYLKRSKKNSRPVAIILLMVILAGAVGYLSQDLWKEIFVFFLIVLTSVYGMTTVYEISNFMTEFQSKQKIDVGLYGKDKKILNLLIGLSASIIFTACLVYLFNMPKIHLILYFMGFGILVAFSKIIIDLYRLFSHMIYLILGYKLDEIHLTIRSQRRW